MLYLYLIFLGLFFLVMWVIMKAGTAAAKSSQYMENITRAIDGDLDLESQRPPQEGAHDRLIRRQTHKTMDECDQALSSNPRSPEGLVDRAMIHLSHKSYDEAIADCNAALRQEPAGYARASYCRALAYMEKNDNDQAILDVSDAIKGNPHDPDYLVTRALLFYRAMEHQLALSDCDAALEIEPEHQKALTVRSLVNSALGETQSALMDAQRALHGGAPNALILTARAAAFYGLRENALALRDCNLAIDWSPDLVDAYLVRAMVRMTLGETEKAAEDVQEALGLAPQHLLTQCTSAWLYATSPDDSIRDGSKALTLAKRVCEGRDERMPNLLDTLAAAYAEVGDYEKAVSVQTRALSHPDYPSTLIEEARMRLKKYRNSEPWREG